MQLSAYAAPQDLRSKRKINGFRLNEILHGSNVDAYGIVVNHNILHPDYMTAFMHNGYNAWIWRLACLRMPRATVYNGDLLYRTLALRPVGDGRTMYVRGEKGEATPQIYYPEGNDWGYGRQANFLMMDVMAMAFGWDKGFDVPASAWADRAGAGDVADAGPRYDGTVLPAAAGRLLSVARGVGRLPCGVLLPRSVDERSRTAPLYGRENPLIRGFVQILPTVLEECELFA